MKEKEEVEKREIAAEVLKLYRAGADRETLLLFMRRRGLFQIDSMIILSETTRIDMGEAKRVVFKSKTWSDRYASTIALQEAAWQALVELSKENGIDLPEGTIASDPPKT